ncbi:hypothetical protein GGR50DRAFT_693829 [Xylaria sp. CBS 124048]|nr:hypothetical protein GGR50DRAFT_693829 [Xylaria sp. CBS 124048]
MSTVRLTFLYPHLFRFARSAESTARPVKVRYRRRPRTSNPHSHSFSTSTRLRQAIFERHGTAVEPLSVFPDVGKPPQPEKSSSQASDPSSTTQHKKRAPEGKEEPGDRSGIAASSKDATAKEATPDARGTTSTTATPLQEKVSETIQKSGPMGAVLQTEPLPDVSQPPHINKPTYVHHFDSYTLVKQLEVGGYTQHQAITVMKAVRAILAQNLDVAQDGLVWKSDVDNETYLFRAACSELSSEVTNNRRLADEQTRQQRTQLQHEFDILNQRMTQDITTLKDNVKGMFHDRRMHVREEQMKMESAIQKINLKITVTLNSDSRSDIESLRWVLISRSVYGIIFVGVLTLSTIQYSMYITHDRQLKAKEKAQKAEELKKTNGREDHASPADAAEILAAN